MENWDDARIFLAVLRAGSTLGAAKALGIAQTTVARRIDALEHGLAVTLFTRDTRGFHPTAAAEALEARAAELERAAKAFYRRASQARDANNQVIRVTTAQGWPATLLTEVIAEFTDIYPEARFQLVNTQDFLDMSKSEADIAIRHGNRGAGDDVVCRKLFTTAWGIYCSRGYAEKHGRPETLDALRDHRVLWYAETFGSDGFKAWRDAHVPPASIVTQCASVPEMLNSIAGGLGLGPIDAFNAVMNDPPLLKCLPFPEEAPTWLLISPEAQTRPIVRDFATLVAKRTKGLSAERVLARQRSTE